MDAGSALFIGMFGAITALFYFQYKTKAKKLDTLRVIIETNVEVDPSVIKALSSSGSAKSDIKFGLVWLGIGISFTVYLWATSSLSEALVGTIAIFIGMALLISGKYKLSDPS